MSTSASDATVASPLKVAKKTDFIALGNALCTAPLGLAVQAKAAEKWAAAAMPTRKTEAWKYTPLKALSADHFQILPGAAADPVDHLLADNAIKLVFVNGVFDAELSTSLEQTGVDIFRLAEASAEQLAVVAGDLGQVAGSALTLFGELNSAAFADAVVVRVAKNTELDRPVQLVHQTTGGEGLALARVLWQQAANSKATLIEQFTGTASAAFTNSVTEISLAENAQCNHYRLHSEGAQQLHIGGVYSELNKFSKLNSFYLSLGSQLQRVDVVTNFKGEGAEAVNNGVYLPRDNHLVDFHTCVEHAVPHCTSSETFRGIIGDSARAVFNGRIHIHKDAQKTLAELSNKNLLTSDKAEVNTKPELEIYADDVRCAHGATIAELDALALYYLRTRGISAEEARVLLSFGFINELIEQLGDQNVIGFLKPRIAERFAKSPELLEHISFGAGEL